MIDAARFDAVILDMDGVITDTAGTHAAAWKRLFDEYLAERASRLGETHRPFDIVDDYRRYVDGKPRYDGVRDFLRSRGITLPEGSPGDEPGLETVRGLGDRKNRYFLAALDVAGPKVYAGTVRFIEAAQAADLRLAAISASRNARRVLEAAGALSYFEAVVEGVEMDRLRLPGKPDPAIFIEAAARVGAEPPRAVVVEDALAGVAAGRAGGFGLVIGVDRGGHREELRASGADLVVADLEEVEVRGRRGERTEPSP